MNNKPKHTFTWLKVLAPVLILEMTALYVMSGLAGNKSPVLSSFLLSLVLLVSLLGLLLGLLLNYLTKFNRAILYYTLGHIISVIILVALVYVMVYTKANDIHYTNLPEKAAFVTGPHDTASTVMSNTDKHAIEQVIFLMEEQYPFGAYDIIDVVTGYAKHDSSAVTCTIVFTLKEEGNRKYISQYIVKEGAPEPVYTKMDTTSTAYTQYISVSAANRY